MGALSIITAAASLVTILAAIVSAVSVLTLIKHRTDTMKDVERELRADLKEATDKMTHLITLVKVTIAEQAGVNRVTELTLAGIHKAMEEHSRAIHKLEMQQLEQQRGETD